MTTTPTDAQMKLAIEMVRKVAQGAAINMAYKQSPILPLNAFKGDLNVILDAIQATEARAQGLVDALEAAQNLLSNSGAESGYCCCGDPVSSHSIGSGHAPVDSHGYYAEKCCQNIDQALATWRRT